MILYENAGYLVDDARRAELLARLLRVAPGPAELASAPDALLAPIARDGGMRPEERIERWRTIARLTLDAGGDLRGALDAASPSGRRKLLGAFPSIGEPGIAKVRLFALDEPCATIESNGLRVLERLGHVGAGSYARQYREATALLAQTYATAADLQRAWHVLREHGQSVCRRSGPDHGACRLGRPCG